MRQRGPSDRDRAGFSLLALTLAAGVTLRRRRLAGVARARDGSASGTKPASSTDSLPTGLPVSWRTPINAGYAGPAVAGGRVFVTDSRRVKANQAIERAIAIDERDGPRPLDARNGTTNYSGLQLVYAIGPRATPTVDGDRVYVLGAMGNLLALDVATGACSGRRTTSRTSTRPSRHGEWPARRWSTAIG